MGMLIWLIVFAGAMLVIFRWMLSWGATMVNRQAVRQFVMQRLSSTHPGMRILHGEEQSVTVLLGRQKCTLRFDQLYRRCAESPHHTSLYIRQAIAGIEQALREPNTLPAQWESLVVPLLLRLDAPSPPDLLVKPIVETLAVGYALDTGNAFRWLSAREVEENGIDSEHLHAVALRNLERSCNILVIESPQLESEGRDRFVRFLTGDGLDATRVLLPSFHERFSARFADSDLLVAIPARDSLAMISSEDLMLANVLAWRNTHERARRAYPLYPRLLQISEHGLLPWTPGESAHA